MSERLDRIRKTSAADLSDGDVKYLWAIVMLDELFRGDHKATEAWLRRKRRLSDDELVAEVEAACNIR